MKTHVLAVLLILPALAFAQRDNTSSVQNGVVNAALASGSSVTERLASAISACASSNCAYVYVPASMGTGWWTPPLPSNVSVWDYRSGSLRIFTGANNAMGSGNGIAVYENGGVDFPPTNPPAGAPVAAYFECNTDGVRPCWGENTEVNVPSPALDQSAVANEADIANAGTEVADPTGASAALRKIGSQVSSGGSVPETAAYFVTTEPGRSVFHHGLYLDGLIDDGLSFRTKVSNFIISQPITGSGVPQTVTVADNANARIGEWISVGAASTQEDVQITAVGCCRPDGLPTTITGIFAKPHPLNTLAYQYAANTGANLSNGLFRSAPLVLGNLANNLTSGIPHMPGYGVLNSTGNFALSLYYDLNNHTHFADIHSGFVWNASDGTTEMTLYPKGPLNAIFGLQVNGAGVPTVTASTPPDNAACTAGNLWFDANYLYVCLASGTVKRVALSAF